MTCILSCVHVQSMYAYANVKCRKHTIGEFHLIADISLAIIIFFPKWETVMRCVPFKDTCT